jgi:hypothetical protein
VPVGLAGGNEVAAALGVVLGLDLLEHHPGEAAVVMSELLRHQEIEDRDALVHGILLLPGRGLHFLEAGADHHRDLLAAEAARGTAAIHGGVAAAQHDDAPADPGDVAERNAGEPVDADMDVGGGLGAAGDVEVATARRTRADEDRVPAFGEEGLEAVDALTRPEIDAEIEDIAALLVDHRFGQAEARNLRANHAARLGVAIEHDAVVAERREIARDGERGGGPPPASAIRLPVLCWAGGGMRALTSPL